MISTRAPSRAKDTLALLGCGNISASKLRKETLLAARILVARRCKQAGMHWRHHNAACVCAIIARLRSAAG